METAPAPRANRSAAIHFAWGLLYPLYQVIGTARHEASHAAVAMLQGARITEMAVLPSHRPERGWLWGYVRFQGGQTDWAVSAAPYACDIIWFALFAWILVRFRRMPAWLWANCLILGILSPWLDIAYNFAKAYLGVKGDVYHLMSALGTLPVQAAFIFVLVAMGVCGWAVIRARGATR